MRILSFNIYRPLAFDFNTVSYLRPPRVMYNSLLCAAASPSFLLHPLPPPFPMLVVTGIQPLETFACFAKSVFPLRPRRTHLRLILPVSLSWMMTLRVGLKVCLFFVLYSYYISILSFTEVQTARRVHFITEICIGSIRYSFPFHLNRPQTKSHLCGGL